MPDFSAEQLAKEATQSTELKTLPVRDYFELEGFVSFAPKVRGNANGYPFVTLINASNEATNIYFSRTCSGIDSNGEQTKEVLVNIDDDVDGKFLSKFVIAYTVKDGVVIPKFASKSNDVMRKSLADIIWE